MTCKGASCIANQTVNTGNKSKCHQWQTGLIDCDLSDTWLEEKDRDFAAGPVADSPFPMQVAQVRSWVRELDPTCCN